MYVCQLYYHFYHCLYHCLYHFYHFYHCLYHCLYLFYLFYHFYLADGWMSRIRIAPKYFSAKVAAASASVEA
jgi:hypothetical protein